MTAPEIASPHWLLVKTCQDLVRKSQSTDPYDKLRMAGLVRHLVVGSHALAARAGSAESAPPTFWFREPLEHEPWGGAEGFDASRRVGAVGEVRRTDRDGFLSARVAHFDGWYSVAAFLAAVDHFYGGAPAHGLEGISRPSMMALDGAMRTRPNLVAVPLQEVAGVTLRALIPFTEGLPKRDAPSLPPPVEVAPSGSACPFAGKIQLG